MIEWIDDFRAKESDEYFYNKEHVMWSGYDGPGWYFWDEVQRYCYGPYPSALKAHEESMRYAKEVLGEPTTNKT